MPLEVDLKQAVPDLVTLDQGQNRSDINNFTNLTARPTIENPYYPGPNALINERISLPSINMQPMLPVASGSVNTEMSATLIGFLISQPSPFNGGRFSETFTRQSSAQRTRLLSIFIVLIPPILLLLTSLSSTSMVIVVFGLVPQLSLTLSRITRTELQEIFVGTATYGAVLVTLLGLLQSTKI